MCDLHFSSAGKYILPPRYGRRVKDFIELYTSFGKSNIMIVGPTGSGKSLFLKIYEMLFENESKSSKIKRPIIKANCAHFGGENSDPNIARSELFGQMKGAHHNALKDSIGLVHEANGGLLILDELGELPKEVQAMLLTFIETGEFRKVGSRRTDKANVRIIGATNREEALRQDFSYRFYPFHIKGMQERREDLLYYCYAYYPKVITNLRGLEVFSILAYNWPGNLREIDRVMQFKLSRNEKWGWMDDKNVIKLKMWLYRLILKRFNEYGGDENDIYRYVKKSGLDIRREFKVFEKLTMPKNALVEITDPALDSDLLKLNPMYIMDKIPEFENAYKGYGLFCYLFGHRSKMNCNIMESIYEGNEFEYDYWKRNSGIFDEKEASLIQTIMMSLKGVKHSTDSSVSILEFWDKLERIRINGKSELQEATKLNNGQIDFKGIGGLTQNELLRKYYEEQLRISNGNKKIAAKKAGLNYSTYYSSLKRVGVKIRKNSTVS